MSVARIRLATSAQLRVVDKLLEPKDIGLPDAAYEGGKLANNSRYGRPCGKAQFAKTLAVYDRSDPGAAGVVIVIIRVESNQKCLVNRSCRCLLE